MPNAWRWDGDDLVVTLHVQPRASRDELSGVHGDSVKVRITAPPVDGKANDCLARFLAAEFGVPRACVELLSGRTGRRKVFRIRTPRTLPPAFLSG